MVLCFFHFFKKPSWNLLCAQLYLLLCDTMNCSPAGFSVHGIFQARILERVAISSSRGSFQPSDWTWVSFMSCISRQILYHWATYELELITYNKNALCHFQKCTCIYFSYFSYKTYYFGERKQTFEKQYFTILYTILLVPSTLNIKVDNMCL